MHLRIVPTILCCDSYNFEHTLSISESGEVYSLGNYVEHEEDCNKIPKPIPSLSNIVGIGCGSIHTVFVDESGVVFSMGINNCGQLGVKQNYERMDFNSPQKVNVPPTKNLVKIV